MGYLLEDMGTNYWAAMQPMLQRGGQAVRANMATSGNLWGSPTAQMYSREVVAPAMSGYQNLLSSELGKQADYARQNPYKEAELTGYYTPFGAAPGTAPTATLGLGNLMGYLGNANTPTYQGQVLTEQERQAKEQEAVAKGSLLGSYLAPGGGVPQPTLAALQNTQQQTTMTPYQKALTDATQAQQDAQFWQSVGTFLGGYSGLKNIWGGFGQAAGDLGAYWNATQR